MFALGFTDYWDTYFADNPALRSDTHDQLDRCTPRNSSRDDDSRGVLTSKEGRKISVISSALDHGLEAGGGMGEKGDLVDTVASSPGIVSQAANKAADVAAGVATSVAAELTVERAKKSRQRRDEADESEPEGEQHGQSEAGGSDATPPES